MGARISSMLRKIRDQGSGIGDRGSESKEVFSLLVSDAEWELVKAVANYPQAIGDAALNLDPSRLAAYLYELSKCFSRFYHDCPILNAENPDLSNARLGLSRAVLLVLKDALHLICVPFLEIM
jgi:arginyl-tRNA synthetase